MVNNVEFRALSHIMLNFCRIGEIRNCIQQVRINHIADIRRDGIFGNPEYLCEFVHAHFSSCRTDEGTGKGGQLPDIPERIPINDIFMDDISKVLLQQHALFVLSKFKHDFWKTAKSEILCERWQPT